MCNEITAHTEAVKDFLSTDPEEMVLRSGADFSKNRDSILISYYAHMHLVSLKDGQILTHANKEVSYNDATLILQYLVQCSGLPARGKWISFLELPDGIHHHVPFIKEAYQPISDMFGYNQDLFAKQAKKLGGKPVNIAHSAFAIPAFPKLSLAIALWAGDEEFPPKATILFDSIAPYQLTTAALWVLGCELVKKMTHNILKPSC